MRIKTIITGPFQENAFLVWDEAKSRSVDSGETRAVIIDPGDEGDRIKEEITMEGLTLGAILITHAHIDHIGAVEDLHQWSNAVVCLPEGEREALDWLPDSYYFFGLPEKPVPKVDYWLGPSHTSLSQVLSPIQRGGLDITVFAAPGHSPGGVCYKIENYCFVGDTLFSGSVGRTDLPGGNWATLQSSLQFLISLPDDTTIFPGHGPKTTIGREKRSNPFLLELN